MTRNTRWPGLRSIGSAGVALAFLQVFGASGQPAPPSMASSPTSYTYRVVREYPHDPEAFTQGLIYRDGFLFESTGLNGRSTLRQVRLETGEVIRQRPLAPQYFGEGLTDWSGTLVQLTWKANRGFLYDLVSLEGQGTFQYPGEGWGLTHDRQRLIMSDGSSSLRFLDPATLRETGRLAVRDGRQPVLNLNELEFVRGEIYANVWQTEVIVKIAPGSGQVVGWIDLGGLRPPVKPGTPIDVLNGIAYDAEGDRLFVTGKLWPKLFEIVVVPRPAG